MPGISAQAAVWQKIKEQQQRLRPELSVEFRVKRTFDARKSSTADKKSQTRFGQRGVGPANHSSEIQHAGGFGDETRALSVVGQQRFDIHKYSGQVSGISGGKAAVDMCCTDDGSLHDTRVNSQYYFLAPSRVPGKDAVQRQPMEALGHVIIAGQLAWHMSRAFSPNLPQMRVACSPGSGQSEGSPSEAVLAHTVPVPDDVQAPKVTSYSNAGMMRA
ncbi:hypothetical protein PV08_08567 [Exophiala spinifera]|uniref:Uncharacterized protein n=1 Tax=Exophiala spinifera TaxID=91928 RepID=A0A0D2BQH0_9EURO|nr:uncharacterized protein PV08_08567 [Exophiala spinifera]KIW13379.1 hypothetical protein PV08_08567 [Exophiala spinifera]